MTRHLLGVGAAVTVIIVCMLLPFFPGGYDVVALALSAMAQLFGIGGLLLVPVAGFWLRHEVARARGANVKDRGYGFALAIGVLSVPVVLVVSLGALVNVGVSFGLLVFGLWGAGAWQLVLRALARRGQPGRPFNAAPLYLVVLPLAATVARFTLVAPAIASSRVRAIDNSAPLIADIERYRDANGRYPLSLAALSADYKPGVMGVPHYRYELSGDAYNVFFEHPSDIFGTREIVMYNKRDEHLFFSHDSDRIAVPPRLLRGGGGFYAVLDAGRPNWKRFLFD